MPYDDNEYLKASLALADAISTLIDNDISPDDVREMVENALDDVATEEA